LSGHVDLVYSLNGSVALFLLNAGPDDELRHLLPSFAAIYPVDFFSLLDCAMRQSTMLADQVAVAVLVLHEGILTCHRRLPTLLQQPHAVLSLESAVTTTIKACKQQCAQLEVESAGTRGAEAAGATAGLQLAVLQRVLPVAEMLHCLAAGLAGLLPQAATSLLHQM
jgi:hypothetical protein